MSIRIEPIKIGVYTVDEISKLKGVKELSQKEVDDIEKFYLLQKSNAKALHMTKNEYQSLLKQRPLLRYRPLKNSFLQKGDKKLLAAGLDIDNVNVNKYIESIVESNFDIQEANKNMDVDFSTLTPDRLQMIKDYIYRHGAKEQAMALFENELSDASSALQRLYKTLRKESGGVFDYFDRPCHLLDNKTAHKMHNVIKYSLDEAQQSGFITEDVNKTACEWALKQIYAIQSNQNLREALKIVKYSG